MSRLYPSLIRRFGCWGIYALCAIIYLNVASGVHAADAERAKRVLLISTGTRFSPGFALTDQGVLEELGKIEGGKVEVYGENLDIIRFPTERFQQIFNDYLTEKYAEQPPDLIILVYVGNLGIAGKSLQQLFPGTPVVVAGLTEEEVRTNQFGSLVSGLALRVDPRATLDLILRLQPETRRIVVIGGTAEVDRDVLNRVKEAAHSLAGQVDFDFWDNHSMAELQQAVSRLPPQTAILISRMFRDGAGQAVISSQVGQSIAQWANVPVYTMTDTNLGTGAVGGSVASAEALGKRAGELARLILTGTAPTSLPFEIRTDNVPMFDWRALKRWGISESRLPPNSIVRFRVPSVWEQYRRYILGALLIICLQSAMIVDLVLQRRRRRRMQAELRQNQQLMELATGAGELGLWARDLRDGGIWANGSMRSLFGFGEHDALRFDDIVARIHPDDRARMASEVEHARVAERPFQGEFRVLPANGTERWVLAKGRTIVEPGGRDERRMGAVLDITERKRAESELRRNRDELAHVTRITTMGELAASLAHELNQPLTAILSNAQAALRFITSKPVDLEEVREILQDIVKDNSRAGDVIRRMRALVKKEELEFAPLDLAGIIRDVVALVHSDAILQNVRVALQATSKLPLVRGDRVQLQQVVLNLLLNAFDAMKGCPTAQREVLVRMELDGNGMVETSVSDHGTGLTHDKLDKIFQPFFTTKRDGLGMGLSISRSIIEAHSGRLWAENNSDQGATFYFTVPTEKSVEGRGSSGE